jgi:hypothetical protein
MVKDALGHTEATFGRQIGRSPRRCESPSAAAKGNVDRTTDPTALVELAFELLKTMRLSLRAIAKYGKYQRTDLADHTGSATGSGWRAIAAAATVVRSGLRYSGFAALSRIERIKAVGPDVIAPAGFLVRITQSLHLDFDIENLESSRCHVSLSLWPISTSKPSVVDRQTASSLGFVPRW